MYRIVKIDNCFLPQVQTYKKVWWFFGKVQWVNYWDNNRTFPTYHHALQQLLLSIEKDLNLKYMDDHEMRS